MRIPVGWFVFVFFSQGRVAAGFAYYTLPVYRWERNGTYYSDLEARAYKKIKKGPLLTVVCVFRFIGINYPTTASLLTHTVYLSFSTCFCGGRGAGKSGGEGGGDKVLETEHVVCWKMLLFVLFFTLRFFGRSEIGKRGGVASVGMPGLRYQ